MYLTSRSYRGGGVPCHDMTCMKVDYLNPSYKAAIAVKAETEVVRPPAPPAECRYAQNVARVVLLHTRQSRFGMRSDSGPYACTADSEHENQRMVRPLLLTTLHAYLDADLQRPYAPLPVMQLCTAVHTMRRGSYREGAILQVEDRCRER